MHEGVRNGRGLPIEEAVEMPDGRIVMTYTHGDPDTPLPEVFYFHGSPGTGKFLNTPWQDAPREAGVRVRAFDRPGCGASDRKPGRKVVDTVDDVEFLADHFGIERFGVLSRSGGGPHALGCMALLGDRVPKGVLMAPLSPPEAFRKWSGQMTEDNQDMYRASADELLAQMKHRAEELHRDKYALLDILAPNLTPYEHLSALVPWKYNHAFANVGSEIVQGHMFGIAEGYGWFDDAIAVNSSWGFDATCVNEPVVLLRGEHDPFSPSVHSEWLESNLKRARFLQIPGASHLDIAEYTGPALHSLRGALLGDQRNTLLLLRGHYVEERRRFYSEIPSLRPRPVPVNLSRAPSQISVGRVRNSGSKTLTSFYGGNDSKHILLMTDREIEGETTYIDTELEVMYARRIQARAQQASIREEMDPKDFKDLVRLSYNPTKKSTRKGFGEDQTAKSITVYNSNHAILTEKWVRLASWVPEGGLCQDDIVIADRGYTWVSDWQVGQPYVRTYYYDKDDLLIGSYTRISTPVAKNGDVFECTELGLDIWQVPGELPEVIDAGRLGKAVEYGYVSEEDAGRALDVLEILRRRVVQPTHQHQSFT